MSFRYLLSLWNCLISNSYSSKSLQKRFSVPTWYIWDCVREVMCSIPVGVFKKRKVKEKKKGKRKPATNKPATSKMGTGQGLELRAELASIHPIVSLLQGNVNPCYWTIANNTFHTQYQSFCELASSIILTSKPELWRIKMETQLIVQSVTSPVSTLLKGI